MAEDTLSDLLRSVRLKGVMFFHVDCVEPWVTEAPDASLMAPVVMPGSEHLMEYHMVIRGDCWASVAGEKAVRVRQGDVIVFPHGDAHVLSSFPACAPSPIWISSPAGRCRSCRSCFSREWSGAW